MFIDVVPNETVKINLTLDPTTGDIDITINWDDATNLDSLLVAYYPFNGNANDESDFINHGTVFGASPTNDRFGKPESAFYFDGEDQL